MKLQKVADYAKENGYSRPYVYVLLRPGGKLENAKVEQDGQLYVDLDRLPAAEGKQQEQPEQAPEQKERPKAGRTDREIEYLTKLLELKEQQIKDKDAEIGFLRKQLENAITLAGMQTKLLTDAKNEMPTEARERPVMDSSTETMENYTGKPAWQQAEQEQAKPKRKGLFSRWRENQ